MVVAMKVKTAEDVKGSKSLRVYSFEAPGHDDLIIIANLTNVYQPGDLVAVAKVGSKLSSFDNIEITQRKLFGIESFGMALGPISDEEIVLGSELGDDWGT